MKTFIFSAFLLLSAAAHAQQALSSSLTLPARDSIIAVADASVKMVASDTSAASTLIAFARTLKGTPYRYGSSDPKRGFDCSGFVMYVFKHFSMTVPRSSSAFTNIGKEIDLKDAVAGDVILFTGTNSKIRKVGHVGIITGVSDSVNFIHASSGKTYAVTETSLGAHYQKRFIKVIRLLQ